MRYDTPVTFVREAPGEYSAATGNYGAGTQSVTDVWANVSDTGTDALQLVYGQLRQGSKTVRIRGQLSEDVDYILIGELKYSPDAIRTYRQEQVYICSQKQ